MRRLLAVLAILMTVAFPVVLAHEGHAHHVMGTVNKIVPDWLEVKDTSGNLVSCKLTSETKYRRGDSPVTVSEIKVGDRVMIEAELKAGTLMAKVVHLGNANPQK